MRSKTLWRGMAFCLLCVELLTCFVSAGSEDSGRFIDVPEGSAFYKSVLWAVNNGITKGTTNTTFSPNATCTRQYILTFLWRSCGSPIYARPFPFADPPSNPDFRKAAQWAYANGVELGSTNLDDPQGKPLFKGDSPCARIDAVLYLFKLERCPYVKPEDVENMMKTFTDLSDLTGQGQETVTLREAVAWALNANITNGTSATTFSPSRICTRGHIVAFLHRYYDGKSNETEI